MQSLLRLVNGTDVLVMLPVPDTIAALAIGKGTVEFVELPGEGGPIHIRPGGVVAVLESSDHKSSGFRAP